MLNETFSKGDVTDVVQDDDENSTVKRIVSVMHLQRKEFVVPIRQFIQDVLQKPLVLHDAHRQCLHLWTKHFEKMSSKNTDLVDLLSFIGENSEGSFPLAWLDFASMVNEVLISRDSFPHGTHKVGYEFK